jgi:hypothetical protein
MSGCCTRTSAVNDCTSPADDQTCAYGIPHESSLRSQDAESEK